MFNVEIMSLQGFINKEFAVTQVTVNVQDVNDNKPYFIYPFEGEAVQQSTAGKINCKEQFSTNDISQSFVMDCILYKLYYILCHISSYKF